jgi:hypothetical protein
MKKIAIWLTYDLGVGGDFEGLYSWLDDKEAIECGNNNAYFKYSIQDTMISDTQLLDALKTELEKKYLSKQVTEYTINIGIKKNKNIL